MNHCRCCSGRFLEGDVLGDCPGCPGCVSLQDKLEEAEHDAKLNASMLSRQTDLAREAENQLAIRLADLQAKLETVERERADCFTQAVIAIKTWKDKHDAIAIAGASAEDERDDLQAKLEAMEKITIKSLRFESDTLRAALASAVEGT